MPKTPDAGPMRLAGSIRFPTGHPALPGHFPGRPLVPGVLLLDAALALIAASVPGTRPGGIAQAKFLAPVGPEQEVAVCCAEPLHGRVRFACLVDGVPVTEGVALLRVPAA